jgi:hypothetical protein
MVGGGRQGSELCPRGAQYIVLQPTQATKSVTIGGCGLRCTTKRSKFSYPHGHSSSSSDLGHRYLAATEDDCPAQD